MISYPIKFETRTESLPGIGTPWNSDANGIRSALAVPPEFEGLGGGLSPEDLFNQALSNCFVATFKVFCEKSKVSFEMIEVDSDLLVDLNEASQPIMKEFRLRARIHQPSNPDRAVLLANKAARSGFILNSVKTNCHFDIEVVA